jgi:hypothetical protein
VPNGRPHDNPLSDLVLHGMKSFPADVEALLWKIHAVGEKLGRYPLGENWPFSPREWEWAKGKDLQAALRDLTELLTMLESGRGDEILINPRTGKPFSDG